MRMIEADTQSLEVFELSERHSGALLQLPARDLQIAERMRVFLHHIRDPKVLVSNHFIFLPTLRFRENHLHAMQAAAVCGSFHEGNHAAETGMEDAEAEGGEGVLLDGVVIF